MADNKPANIPTEAIGTIFRTVARDVQTVLQETRLDTAVDIELTFRTASINERGFLIFSRTSKESTFELRLAARVTSSGPVRETVSTRTEGG